MSQTFALLFDAYRDLQARKLFWITLILSAVVAGAFAFVGINATGLTIFWWSFPGAWNSSLIPPAMFYKFVFTTIGIPWWLGLFASILALVSVCGIFPDFISGGAIDLYLSKPIGRLRLFLTKYLFALLFVALQVFIFTLISFLIIGIRGKSWSFSIFMAVPLVTVFFSYLFCVCVLLGVMTRSAIAALLLTLLFWCGLWSLNTTDVTLTPFAVAAQARVDAVRSQIADNEKLLRDNAARPTSQQSNLSQFEFQLDVARKSLSADEATAKELRWWQRLFVYIRRPLPKTNETVALMNRWLVDHSSIEEANQESRQERQSRGGFGRPPREENNLQNYMQDPATRKQVDAELNGRSAAGIIGSSLAFEALVLLLAAWIFCKRDY